MPTSPHWFTLPRQAAAVLESRARRIALLFGAALCVFLTTQQRLAEAQSSWSLSPEVSHVIVPQFRGYPLSRTHAALRLTTIRAHASLNGRIAETTLQLEVINESNRAAEAIIVLPVPGDATVGHFDFSGSGLEPAAEILHRDIARNTYQSIVNRLKDPALLEFAGYAMLKTRVFPVPANGRQSIRICYEQILDGVGSRVDYTLPRSATLEKHVAWEVTARIANPKGVGQIYSPSHGYQISSHSGKEAHLRFEGLDQPGAVQLSCQLGGDSTVGTLFAYPDPGTGGGYFLFAATAPSKRTENAFPREVTLVLDCSGSMAGGKLDQVRRATLQFIEGLGPNEVFNVIDYSTGVRKFSPGAVLATPENIERVREYLRRLRPNGGTNIHDALVEALSQPIPRLPRVRMIVFMTDGLPTIGKRREHEIHAAVSSFEVGQRRIFTIGVGSDVNAPLLDRIAEQTRGSSAYVLPGEDVELRVASILEKLRGPVMASPILQIVGPDGAVQPDRVWDVMPPVLPDVFTGEQIVVTGRYRGTTPMRIRIVGESPHGQLTFRGSFDLAEATTLNAFVPRLWASRKIAYLSDDIRQATLDGSGVLSIEHRAMVERVVALSQEFGILTEYTAFLSREGTDLTNWSSIVREASRHYAERAQRTRSGLGAVNQSSNVMGMKKQYRLNPTNGYIDAVMDQTAPGGACQIATTSRLRRGNVWIEGKLANSQSADALEVDERVTFGTSRYWELVDHLCTQNRQALVTPRTDVLVEVDGNVVLFANGELVSP